MSRRRRYLLAERPSSYHRLRESLKFAVEASCSSQTGLSTPPPQLPTRSQMMQTRRCWATAIVHSSSSSLSCCHDVALQPSKSMRPRLGTPLFVVEGIGGCTACRWPTNRWYLYPSASASYSFLPRIILIPRHGSPRHIRSF